MKTFNVVLHLVLCFSAIVFAFLVGGFEILAFLGVGDYPKLLAAVAATTALFFWAHRQSEHAGRILNC